MAAKMRHCCVCGADLGVIEDKHYERRDTCGRSYCEREMQDAEAAERIEAHAELDRAHSWDY